VNLPDPAAAALQFQVPFYGDPALLRETVASVLAQTDPRWRMTIVEDGPRDDSVRNWLGGLDEPRIRYESNSKTLGVAGNFQRCLDLADSDYVVFLGCDDRLHPSYVSHVLAAIAEHPDVAIVQPGVRVIDGDGTAVRPLGDRLKARLNPAHAGPAVVEGEPLMTSLMRGNWTYFPSLVWRRERIATIGFRQDLQIALDLVALVTLVLNGERLLVTNHVVFEYRRHRASASSISAANADRFLEERRVYKEFEQRARSRHWLRAARAARLRLTSRLHALALVPRSIRCRAWTKSKAYLRHALFS